MKKLHYKRKYHPLIILLYTSNMLSPEQVKQIPRTTRNTWDKFTHCDCFGYEIAKDYIEDFDEIKNVLSSKHLKQGVKFMCALSYGYKNVISEIENSNKLLLKHAEDISFSIKQFARFGSLTITEACQFFGVSKDWFYRHRNKGKCLLSKIGKCFK